MFSDFFGEGVISIVPMPESGSNRNYYRITGKSHSAIGIYNSDLRENEAYFYLTEQLRDNDLNVPLIYSIHHDRSFYLMEDLGDVTMYSWLRTNNFTDEFSPEAMKMYKRVIDEMPKFQIHAARNLDFSKCYPRAEFDAQSVMWDLNYFKYYFLKLAGVTIDEQYLQDDFESLTDFLLEADRNFFIYRDFQSRNIMIHDDRLYFIDFQGGRKGALQYDPASLLFEAKTHLSGDIRNELIEYYITVISHKLKKFNSSDFLHYYHGYVLIRILQAMGAYGYRGYFERKSYFLQSIPPALENLSGILQSGTLQVHLPELYKALSGLMQSSKIDELYVKDEQLTLVIRSFSYKKGIPPDYTEHGGGFIFDCRGLPNPGRHERYQQLTGRNKEVADFLGREKQVDKFLQYVFVLINDTLKTYRQRGFTRLSVAFGCTGGQHRSVYCAEKLKDMIVKQPGIKVLLYHRELNDTIN